MATKLQSMEKDDLIKVLKKTLEQQKHLKEQLAQATKEKEDALSQLSATTSNETALKSPKQENGFSNHEVDELRAELKAEYEAKLSREKGLTSEASSSLKAMSIELADYDKQIKSFKEEKSSMATKLETALKEHDELSKSLTTCQEELKNSNHFNVDLEKALEIAKREAEDLRLQKREVETSKMELMQTKIHEDSHSVKQVLDLTNELSQTSLQIDMLKASLASVKAQRDSLASETQVLSEKLTLAQEEHTKYIAKTKLMYNDTWKNRIPSTYDNLNQEIGVLKQELQGKDVEIERIQNEATMRAEESMRWSEKVSRAEREAEKWKAEAEANISSLTRAMDDLRELRSRYETAGKKRDHEGVLDKIISDRKLDSSRFEQVEHKLKSEIDGLRRERDELQKQLDNVNKMMPTSSTPAPSTPSMQNRSVEKEPVHQTYSSRSIGSPTFAGSEPIPEASLHDVLFGDHMNDTIEGSIYGGDEYPIATVSQLKETLKVAEQQNTTLRELLAESEGNNELFADQVSLLKEEIRRTQRNNERENHINNTEYIKNIIFQFMRPEKVSGERRQLLQILRTMLQLNDEEYKVMFDMTTEAAPLDSPSTSGVSSLSSFFHRWNGL
ncbi:unnamed protein product, partial [Mesorhabditis belari]|uniref:GRIP domain-containing protein n=1 Tax=Mesorhabditis belari TaxID=2138241 RepID=A0AAF3ECI4_9BILA